MREAESTGEESDELQDDIQHAVNAVAQLTFMSNDSSPEAGILAERKASHSSVGPMPIRSRVPTGSRPSANPETQGSTSSSDDLNGARTPSPSSRLPVPEFLGVDGPMTPRNDVGPFIFDGSAGLRVAQTRMHSALSNESSSPTAAN